MELRADVLVPGFASRKLGQIPCEDVMIRFPIPECWIYLFRVEKHFRYGSVKSAHRRLVLMCNKIKIKIIFKCLFFVLGQEKLKG